MIPQTLANPLVAALVADQFPGMSFDAAIHAEDEMFLFDLPIMKGDRNRTAIHYLAQGKRICGNLSEITNWYFGGFEGIGRFMDFACGYGRLTRHLVHAMPAERIWVSDIYASAVAHQQATFGVSGIVSTVDPTDYPAAPQFDCIYVGSLFSHLPQASFNTWLSKLHSMLSENGILVFSVVGMWLLPKHIARPVSGCYFSPFSESRSLDKADYGTMFVTDEYVRSQVSAAIPGGRYTLHRIPLGLANRQDLYVIAKGHPVNGDLHFTYGPDGWIEKCRITEEGLYLRGWAADLNAGGSAPRVIISLDGQAITEVTPLRDRQDVAAHFDNMPTGPAGWSAEVKLPGVSPSAILMAKVISECGMEHVFSVERVSDLIARTAGNPE